MKATQQRGIHNKVSKPTSFYAYILDFGSGLDSQRGLYTIVYLVSSSSNLVHHAILANYFLLIKSTTHSESTKKN